MGGLTFEKLLVIGVIAVFLLGPDRLPHYAAQLAKFVKRLREFTDGAKERMRDELGPDFDDVDWKKLDPRQYDPRRIIRDALLDDSDADASGPSSARPAALGAAGGVTGNPFGAAAGAAAVTTMTPLPVGAPAPFDDEAT